MYCAKIGAIAYALWSVLHLFLGVTRLADRIADGTLAEASGRLAQGHWTLLYLGVFGLIVSRFNWRNDVVAYWLAVFVISAEDIGYLIFPVFYGEAPLPASAIGPVLWIVGLLFTSIGYVQGRRLATKM